MIALEDGSLKLVRSLTLRKVRNKFQDELRKDILSIKKSKNICLFADKTKDINSYNKLLLENIFETYRKTNNKPYNSINKEANIIAEEFDIGDRLFSQNKRIYCLKR